MTIEDVRNQMLAAVEQNLNAYEHNVMQTLAEERKQIMLTWEYSLDNMVEYMRQNNLIK